VHDAVDVGDLAIGAEPDDLPLANVDLLEGKGQRAGGLSRKASTLLAQAQDLEIGMETVVYPSPHKKEAQQ